jgi:hypothetical protein
MLESRWWLVERVVNRQFGTRFGLQFLVGRTTDPFRTGFDCARKVANVHQGILA